MSLCWIECRNLSRLFNVSLTFPLRIGSQVQRVPAFASDKKPLTLFLITSRKTNLWEGHVLRCVCPSLQWEGFHLTIKHDDSLCGLFPLVTALTPPPSPASDIWWSRLESCSNLFTWELHCICHQLVLTSGGWLRTVGKQRYVSYRNALLVPPPTKLGQGHIFRSMCQESCPRGEGLYQHALQVSRPTPRGKLRGLA